MYLFSFAILSIYIILIFKFSEIFKKSQEKLPVLVTLSDMIPLDVIGKDVSDVFPKQMVNLIKSNQDYVWATTTCASCRESLLETSSVMDASSNINTLQILTTEPNTSFEEINSNFNSVPAYKYISTSEMGAILYSSPCYFKVDSQGKISDVSLNYRFIS